MNGDIKTNKDQPLIYCSGEGTECEIKSKEENGYFLNSGKTEYVVCGNSGCIEKKATTLAGACLAIDKYKLTLNVDFKYCDGVNSNDINTTKLKYYEVEDRFLPGKYFDYPTEFIDERDIPGNLRVPLRKILIKTQPYSLTAVDNENIPIGYIKDETGYMECRYDKEGKKECNHVNIGKTICEVAGELFKTEAGAKTNLCIDPSGDVSVDLTMDTVPEGIDSEGQYVISVAGGLFGI